jgi:hypothetical protein
MRRRLTLLTHTLVLDLAQLFDVLQLLLQSTGACTRVPSHKNISNTVVQMAVRSIPMKVMQIIGFHPLRRTQKIPSHRCPNIFKDQFLLNKLRLRTYIVQTPSVHQV